MTSSAAVDLTAEAGRLRALADPAPGRVLYVLSTLALADHLRDGPTTTTELAQAVRVAPDALRRILRAAGDLGVVRPEHGDRWSLLPAGHLLRSDVPGSLRAEFGDNDLFLLWGGLLHSVRTGEPSYPRVFGSPMFERLTATPEAMCAFHQHMYDRAQRTYGPLLGLRVWPPGGTVVDVMGGTGGLLGQLMASRPGLVGVLHDLPEVLALSPLRGQPELAGRLRFAAGDIFRSPPPPADTYLLASVLHDWADDAASGILRHCRAVGDEDCRLLVVDRVLPAQGPSPGYFNDLLMLAAVGGRERTLPEWDALLRGGGFVLAAVHATAGTELAVLECRPSCQG